MNEAHYKIQVLEWIREASDDGLPVIALEFSLYGTNIRSDIAALSNDGFVGVEIKSAGDTLRRLPSQLAGYARCFDQTILVAAPKHLRSLLKLDLHGASLWTIDHGERKSHSQGTPNLLKPSDYLRLMTQEDRAREMRQLVRRSSGDVALPPSLSSQVAREAFEATFRRRYAQRSQDFWASVAGRPIEGDDLRLLSRFYEDRRRASDAEQARELFWKNWASTAHEVLANSQG